MARRADHQVRSQLLYSVEQQARVLTSWFALSTLNARQQKDLSALGDLLRPVITEDLAVDGHCDSIVELNLHLRILFDQFAQQLPNGPCTDQHRSSAVRRRFQWAG